MVVEDGVIAVDLGEIDGNFLGRLGVLLVSSVETVAGDEGVVELIAHVGLLFVGGGGAEVDFGLVTIKDFSAGAGVRKF